jgi:YggT family protein
MPRAIGLKGGEMFVLANLLAAVAKILHMLLIGYMWVIIIRALISWVNPDPYNQIVRTLFAVTEPVLSRLRRKLPLFAGSIDFSPIVVIIIIYFLDWFLVGTIADLSIRLR